MGRHSARDDDFEESFDVAAVALAAPVDSRGRHSRPDEDQPGPPAFDDTARIARVNLAEAMFAEPARPAAAQPPKRTPEHSTAADLALVRAHGDVRAGVIATLIVPFAIYTGWMIAVGKLDRFFLLWIWIPLITAGVLAGLTLDLGHRKYDR